MRETEKKVRTKKTVQEIVFEKPMEILDLEEKLQKHYGTKAEIITLNKGGKIQITYYSDEDLERIMEILMPE